MHGHDKNHLISGYRVRQIEKDQFEWTLLGKADPREIEIHHPVVNTDDNVSLAINAGDWIAVRCEMENDDDKEIHHGNTHSDEMCSFHLLYYIDNGHATNLKFCNVSEDEGYSWKSQFISPMQILI